MFPCQKGSPGAGGKAWTGEYDMGVLCRVLLHAKQSPHVAVPKRKCTILPAFSVAMPRRVGLTKNEEITLSSMKIVNLEAINNNIDWCCYDSHGLFSSLLTLTPL